ncbi:glutathione peroxidase gpx1 [Borealophlyctis nickersoniae]|nr:glutathione peroxidase gpx1 [Borealophlyctis nickersoniae]
MSAPTSFYDIKVNDNRGNPLDLAETCRGKVVLVVNVASKCGYTPQYKGLEDLYQKYKDRGFVVLGAPCNQFGNQEPGSAEEAAEFCSQTYNVSFPILEKLEVNGDNAHPLYQFLKGQKAGILGLTRIKWNFEKFLLNREGGVASRFGSMTTPESLHTTIEPLL